MGIIVFNKLRGSWGLHTHTHTQSNWLLFMTFFSWFCLLDTGQYFELIWFQFQYTPQTFWRELSSFSCKVSSNVCFGPLICPDDAFWHLLEQLCVWFTGQPRDAGRCFRWSANVSMSACFCLAGPNIVSLFNLFCWHVTQQVTVIFIVIFMGNSFLAVQYISQNFCKNSFRIWLMSELHLIYSVSYLLFSFFHKYCYFLTLSRK